MQKPRITNHARQRLQQRGSRPIDVAIVMSYGDIEVPARDGCRWVQLSQREAARLQNDGSINVSDIDRARRLVLLVGPEGSVVTILKRSPDRRISSRRAGTLQ